jgi:hypothetical protein
MNIMMKTNTVMMTTTIHTAAMLTVATHMNVTIMTPTTMMITKNLSITDVSSVLKVDIIRKIVDMVNLSYVIHVTSLGIRLNSAISIHHRNSARKGRQAYRYSLPYVYLFYPSYLNVP